MRMLQILVIALVTIMLVGTVAAVELTVLGLSPVKLKGGNTLDFVIYDREGVKSGEILEAVSSNEVAGLPVLDESGGRLVLISLRETQVWLRSDWLTLSDAPLPPCPKVRPGGTDDQVVPGVAGVGPACRRDG